MISGKEDWNIGLQSKIRAIGHKLKRLPPKALMASLVGSSFLPFLHLGQGTAIATLAQILSHIGPHLIANWVQKFYDASQKGEAELEAAVAEEIEGSTEFRQAVAKLFLDLKVIETAKDTLSEEDKGEFTKKLQEELNRYKEFQGIINIDQSTVQTMESGAIGVQIEGGFQGRDIINIVGPQAIEFLEVREKRELKEQKNKELQEARQAVEANPTDLKVHEKYARLLIADGQYDQAEVVIAKGLKQNSNHAPLLYLMARVLGDCDNPNAKEFYAGAIKGSSIKPEFYRGYAEYLKKQDVLSGAFAVVKQGREVFKDDIDLASMEKELTQQMQAVSEAEQQIIESVLISPKNLTRYLTKIARNKPEKEVRDVYEAAILRYQGDNKTLARTHFNFAGLLIERWKYFEEAKSILKLARKVDHKDSYICNRLGKLYEEVGRLPEAIEEYKSGIEVDPGNHANYTSLVSIYLWHPEYEANAGGRENTIRLLQKSLEISKGPKNKAGTYAQLAASVKDTDAQQAEHYLDQTVEYYRQAGNNFQLAKALAERARICDQLGKVEKATYDFKESLKLSPDSTVITDYKDFNYRRRL